MSTGPERKRAKTIDAFFAHKLAKTVVGIEPPRTQGSRAHCAMDSACAGNEDGALDTAAQPRQASVVAPTAAEPTDAEQQPCSVDAAAGLHAGWDAQCFPPRSPQATAGRKRRSRSEGSPLLELGTAATDALRDFPAGPGDPPPSEVCAEGRAEGPALDTAAPGQQQRDAAPDPAAATAEDGLTPAERSQITANRNRALVRRAVAEASAPGAPPLQLSALLVEPSWRQALAGELAGLSVRQLEAFLRAEWAPGRKAVFPPRDCIFQAFNACPFDQVRVVILGQDPYHGPGQAMGLSFSVPRNVRPLPPSLVNIYKEAAIDLGWADRPHHGDLSAWSVQGVLLLNTCLTVRQGEANSHAKRGWEQLTDAAIRALSERRSGLVFLLWGNPAQAKASLVNTRKHHVLKAAHPSPLSASRGFFGCRHFSKANRLLQAQGREPVEWWPS